MLAGRHESGIVGRGPDLESMDREIRIKGEASLDRRLRLLQPPEIGQGGGEKEMSERLVSVALDRASHPHDGFLV